MSVGLRVFLNFRTGQPRPAQSRLLGWSPDRFLLLAEPDTHDAPLEYRADASWVLKYVAGGYVCAAHTRYLERSSPAIDAVYVSFPKKIHVHSLRLHRRIDVRLPVRYVYPDPDGTLPDKMAHTTLCDLSLGGCAIWVVENVELGTRLCVAVAPTPDVEPVMFVGTVRRCIAGLGGHAVGMEFDPVDEEQHATLAMMLGDDATRPDLLAEDA